MAGRDATPEQIAAIARSWGLDRPIYVQYAQMMDKIFTGSVISYTQQINVLDQIKRGLPATISLAVGAGIIWLTFGIIVGLLSSLRPGRFLDRVLTFLSLVAISAPVFVIGAVLLYFFAYRTSILPTGGYVPFTDNPWQWFVHMLLPWIALSLPFIGFYSRVLRGNVLDAKHDDYVRMARAKGLSGRRVLTRHVLRNSLIPIMALWGLDFAGVIGGGAILVESIFDLGGVGQYAAESIQTLDVPPIMVIVMYTAVLVVVVAALDRHPVRLPRSDGSRSTHERHRPVAARRRPQRRLRHRRRESSCRRPGQLLARRRRDPVRDRRVRLRQVGHDFQPHGPDQSREHDVRRNRRIRRNRAHRCVREDTRACPRSANSANPPRPDDRAQSSPEDRRPDRGADTCAHRRVSTGSGGTGGRAHGASRNPSGAPSARKRLCTSSPAECASGS